MITTVYFIRHSIPFKEHRGTTNTNETILVENEKSPLSISGEKLAEEKSLQEEFNNLDVVYSSNYVRAMSTAKYFASKNNLKVNILSDFNERIHGVASYDELPTNFELLQFKCPEYKIGFGESQSEVQERMYNALINVINKNVGKRIAIVSHATAITFLLKKWCDIKYEKYYKFKGNIFFDGKWDYLETFKLTFKNENLISIENIKDSYMEV